MQPPNFAVYMAAQNNMMQHMASTYTDYCWDLCYDRNITRDDLLSGAVLEEARQAKLHNCQRRCIGRHFEVNLMMVEGRANKEREMMAQFGGGA